MATSRVVVRLDEESKSLLSRAAKLRRISVSDYVRIVIIPQARSEVHAAKRHGIALTAEEQQAFWKALSATPELTKAQRSLGSLMRGEL